MLRYHYRHVWGACYLSSVRCCPTTLPTLLHISTTDTTCTEGRSIRDLRRRVSSSVIFVARSWCSFNTCSYFHHCLVAFTARLLFSYYSNDASLFALDITPNLHIFRTLVRAGHGKTLYFVTHTYIINESIIIRVTQLST